MKVIVNGENRILSKENNFEGFIYRLLCRLCREEVANTYYFLTHDNKDELPERALPVSFPVPLGFRAVRTRFLNRKLASFIRDQAVQAVITLNRKPVSSPATQLLAVPDDADTKTIRNAALFLQKAKAGAVITPSMFLRQKLLMQGIPEAVVYLLPQAAAFCYQPMDWEQKEDIKIKYTGGRAFFLMPLSGVPDQHIIYTLKAFSQFKKWQQSNMQLVLLGSTENKKYIVEQLQSYKYRESVIWLKEQPEEAAYAAILASALAMIYLPGGAGNRIVITEAMQCGTPVITVSTAILSEAGEDTVLFCDLSDVSRLAGEMVKLYKDEKFRNQLSAKAIAAVLPLGEENALRRLKEYIQQSDTA